MNKFIMSVICILFSVSVGFASVSAGDVRDIYNKIVAANRIKPFPLKIINKNEVNAMTFKDHIEIYTGLMKMTTKDEVALVLGHELSHYLAGDVYTIGGNQKWIELRADYNGSLLMSKAGYDRCKGANLFIKFYKEDGADGGDHPSPIFRYEIVHYGCQ